MAYRQRFEPNGEDCVFFLPSEQDENLAIQLCGISYCPPGYRIGFDEFPNPAYTFEYIVSGSGFYQINGHSFRPSAGDAYIVPRGHRRHYWTAPADPWTKIWFNVSGELVENLMAMYHLEGVYFLPQCFLEQAFRNSWELVTGHLADARYGGWLAICTLLYHIGNHLRSAAEPFNPEAAALKKYLEQNFNRNFDLALLCRLIHRSPSQVFRIFKRAWGVSPLEYHTEHRLKMARSLLHNTPQSVKEIAAALGFPDQYYFSRIFKRHTGVSPRNYRIRGSN